MLALAACAPGQDPPSGQTTTQGLEPQYEGGYPTAETAAAAFDEHDYQAATQFYVWGYAYLNTIGVDKGFAAMGGDASKDEIEETDHECEQTDTIDAGDHRYRRTGNNRLRPGEPRS